MVSNVTIGGSEPSLSYRKDRQTRSGLSTGCDSGQHMMERNSHILLCGWKWNASDTEGKALWVYLRELLPSVVFRGQRSNVVVGDRGKAGMGGQYLADRILRGGNSGTIL